MCSVHYEVVYAPMGNVGLSSRLGLFCFILSIPIPAISKLCFEVVSQALCVCFGDQAALIHDVTLVVD